MQTTFMWHERSKKSGKRKTVYKAWEKCKSVLVISNLETDDVIKNINSKQTSKIVFQVPIAVLRLTSKAIR